MSKNTQGLGSMVLLPILGLVLAACGGGGPSTPRTVNAGAPTTPTNLVATAISPHQVDLNWKASTDNIAVLKYLVFRSDRAPVLAETAATAYEDRSVSAGGTFGYRVQAVDADGNNSGLSETATVTTPADSDTVAPSAPSDLRATSPSATRIDLVWTASTDNVGVAKYLVSRTGVAGTLTETTGTSFTDSTVVGGTTYTYQVRAVDAANNLSPWSNLATVQTGAAPDTEAPSRPRNLSAQPVSATQINLGWEPSTDNVGVAKYVVIRAGTSDVVAETTTTSFSDTTVVGDTPYTYQVGALDAANNRSDWSASATARTPPAPDTESPSIPGGLRATATSATRVNLDWNASTDNVGVAKYQVFRVGVSGVLAETSTPGYTDASVLGSTNYSYQVRALDAANNASAVSASAAVSTPAASDAEAPSIPTNLSATAQGPTRVSLNWTASTDNVGVAKYQVFRVGVSGVLAETATPGYTDATVVGSTTYSYQVRALDAANNASALSASAVVSTPPAPDTVAPSVPTGLIATAQSSTRVYLSWNASTDNVGVAKYQVFRVGVPGVLAETATPNYLDASVAGSTNYSYQVRALDAANNASALSASAAVSTPAPTTAPAFTTHPGNQTVLVGASATFTAAASGNPAPLLQWQRSIDGGSSWSDIAGQTNPTYILVSARVGDSGMKLRVLATNIAGSVHSQAATLTVTVPAGFYVAVTGANTNPGSFTQPWRTISHAVATAPTGATIYVQAGRYAENVVFSKDGQSVIGYKSTPGDQPLILAQGSDPFAAFDSAEQPLIDGGNRAAGIGVSLRGRKDITLKNIAISNFAYGLIAGNPVQGFVENHTLFNVNVSTVGDLSSSYSGLGISFGSMGTKYSNSNRITHALIVNAAAEGLTLNGDGNTADDVKVYCNDTTNANAATDYYVMVTGNNNVVRNSLVNRKPGLAHNGHGFSIKSNAEQVVDQGLAVPVVNPQFNTFENNVAINVGEGFVVRHRGVRFNTFIDNAAYGTHTGSGSCKEGNGIAIRDGASDNLFLNTTIENTCSAISFSDTVEDGDTGPNPTGHPGHNNVIDGARVRNSYFGVRFSDYSVPSDAGANTIKNSTFVLTRYMHYAARRATQMTYINNSYSGTNAVVPKPGGYFRGSTYASDVIPAQFTGCTYANIEGGMPPGF